MAETELERAQKRYEQARARLQALRNREAARERKIDTRRKVILGGALMDLATRDTNAAAMTGPWHFWKLSQVLISSRMIRITHHALFPNPLSL